MTKEELEFTEEQLINEIQANCQYLTSNALAGYDSPIELLLRNDLIPLIQKYIFPACSASEMKKPGQFFVGAYHPPGKIDCYIWTYEK